MLLDYPCPRRPLQLQSPPKADAGAALDGPRRPFAARRRPRLRPHGPLPVATLAIAAAVTAALAAPALAVAVEPALRS